jgi:hypothetical protein
MSKGAARDLFWLLVIEVCLERGVCDLGIRNSRLLVARLFFLRDSRERLSMFDPGKARRILNGTLDSVIIFSDPCWSRYSQGLVTYSQIAACAPIKSISPFCPQFPHGSKGASLFCRPHPACIQLLNCLCLLFYDRLERTAANPRH